MLQKKSNLCACVCACVRAFMRVYLHNSHHHELNGPSYISLMWHGAAECLHGHMIRASEQRLSIHSDQLVIDVQASIL